MSRIRIVHVENETSAGDVLIRWLRCSSAWLQNKVQKTVNEEVKDVRKLDRMLLVNRLSGDTERRMEVWKEDTERTCKIEVRVVQVVWCTEIIG